MNRFRLHIFNGSDLRRTLYNINSGRFLQWSWISKDHWLKIFFRMSVIVKILLVMKVFFGSALQLYVIVEMLWPIISQKIERKWLLKLGPYFLRAALTLFSRNHLGKWIFSTLSILVSLAISVPNLANIIPLVGITSGII